MEKELLNNHIGNHHIKVIEAMEMIDKNAAGLIFAVDDDGRLIGCVTDGDIRRWILKSGSLDAPIEVIMSRNPFFLMSGDEELSQTLLKEKDITALPIIDDDHHIINIIRAKDSWKKKRQVSVLQGVPVVIMAGGKGTRLYPYTNVVPKPLIPVDGIPIVERIIKLFADFGINHVFMTVNYKKGMIKSYFSDVDFPVQISFVEEDRPLGTGGSLRLIKDDLSVPLFVTNCDSLILTDYSELYNFHKNSGNDITMVTALKKYVIPYGVINFGESGEIISMEEKPTQSFFINTGMYIVNPDTLDLIPKDEEFHMPQLVDRIALAGGKVGTYPVSEDSFLDMGEFDEMKRMEDKLKSCVKNIE